MCKKNTALKRKCRVISEKAKKRMKERKERHRRNRPEYMKKRVLVPAVTGMLLIILWIMNTVHSTYFQITDNAYVKGPLINAASQPDMTENIKQNNYAGNTESLTRVIPKNDVWVVANFKEIQLANIKPGQPVFIKVDAYPEMRFEGEVQSIDRETAAKQESFPPEKKSGNYEKALQRIPVKIIFKEDVSRYDIVPGMTVTAKVKVK